MKIFTEKAIQQIRANEDAELCIISFALGLLGARVHIGTDFVEYDAWGVGFKGRQYIKICNILGEGTYYTAVPHLKSAAKVVETEIAKRKEYADLTDCILLPDDGARTFKGWAEKCCSNSIILRLIESILSDDREDDDREDDDLFSAVEVILVRDEILINSFSRQSIANVLVSAWQELGEK